MSNIAYAGETKYAVCLFTTQGMCSCCGQCNWYIFNMCFKYLPSSICYTSVSNSTKIPLSLTWEFGSCLIKLNIKGRSCSPFIFINLVLYWCSITISWILVLSCSRAFSPCFLRNVQRHYCLFWQSSGLIQQVQSLIPCDEFKQFLDIVLFSFILLYFLCLWWSLNNALKYKQRQLRTAVTLL